MLGASNEIEELADVCGHSLTDGKTSAAVDEDEEG